MDQHMNQKPLNLDDAYRAPRAEPVTEHSTFSAEEWRYLGKVYASWFFGGVLLLAMVVTGQIYFSLSQFGGQEYLARVVTLSVLSQYGPGLVMAAACNTLAMVTERRAKRAIVEPVEKVPWSLVGLFGVLSPMAMGLILGLSLAIITFVVGIPLDTSWTGIRAGAHLRDMVISTIAVVVCAFVVVGTVSQTMRILTRFRGWLLLKFIITNQIMGLIFVLVKTMVTLILS